MFSTSRGTAGRGSSSNQIVEAIRDNNVKELETLLGHMSRDGFARVNFRLEDKWNLGRHLHMDGLSLMHIAALYDALDCFIFLEQQDLKYDQQSAASCLPIHYACRTGAYEVACYIIHKDPAQARIVPQGDNAPDLVYLATVAGNADIVKLLLDNGAAQESVKNRENQALKEAIQFHHVDCLRLLLRHNHKMHDQRLYSALMFAIIKLEKDAVRMLLEAGDDPNYFAPDHTSALFLACYHGEGWLDIVELLASRVTKIDLDPHLKKKAAIHWACQSQCPEIVELLLRKGIDVNRLDEKGKTGLYYLLDTSQSFPEEKLIRVMEIMLEHGLSLTGPNLSIIVDFIKAITKQPRVIGWLFAHGVPPDAVYEGKTIRDYVAVAKRTSRPMREVYDKWCVVKQ